MSFSVLLFLGEPPKDAKDWRTSNNLVDKTCYFVNGRPDTCENCMNNINSIDVAFIDLDASLLQRAVDIEEHNLVDNFLKENLQWRVQKVGIFADLMHMYSDYGLTMPRSTARSWTRGP
jgi:tyrosinase